MAYKIVLTDRFMDSEFVPAVCLFSGRTDAVKPKKMNFTYMPPSATAGFLIGGVLGMYLMSKRFSMELPTAPWERFKWSWKKNLWALPIFVLPAVFCLGTIPFVQRQSETPLVMAAIGAGLGLIITIAGSIWAWMTQVSFKPTDEGEVTVRIPNRMKSVYEVYFEAVKTHTEERRKRRRSRGLGGEDDGASDEEEDWADDGSANWDQGKK